MSHIIAITNQKGGVGKTTTAVSLAAVLAESGADVLLIDMDPQANATVACGVERRSVEHGVMDVMLGTRSVEDTCIYCENSHIWLMPANADLTGSDEALFQENMRHALLKKHIHGWAERFDWVLIDCPPTLNLLTVNALVAANYVLVPIQCEYFALEGVSALLDTVGQLRRMGVEIQEPVADHERAVLFKLEVSPGLYEYYIGLNNFYAVWQYNHSRMYVTAVRDIANGVGSGGL